MKLCRFSGFGRDDAGIISFVLCDFIFLSRGLTQL